MRAIVRFGQKVVYQTDPDKFYVGETVADPDPKNPGNWLIPAGCVEKEPPDIPKGSKAQWADYKWKLISV